MKAEFQKIKEDVQSFSLTASNKPLAMTGTFTDTQLCRKSFKDIEENESKRGLTDLKRMSVDRKKRVASVPPQEQIQFKNENQKENFIVHAPVKSMVETMYMSQEGNLQDYANRVEIKKHVPTVSSSDATPESNDQVKVKHTKNKDSYVVFNRSSSHHLRLSSHQSNQNGPLTDRYKESSTQALQEIPFNKNSTLQLQTSSKYYPFYAENNAFIESNYTFRPNSNMVYENIMAYQQRVEQEDLKQIHPQFERVHSRLPLREIDFDAQDPNTNLFGSSLEDIFNPNRGSLKYDVETPSLNGLVGCPSLNEYMRKSSPGKLSLQGDIMQSAHFNQHQQLATNSTFDQENLLSMINIKGKESSSPRMNILKGSKTDTGFYQSSQSPHNHTSNFQANVMLMPPNLNPKENLERSRKSKGKRSHRSKNGKHKKRYQQENPLREKNLQLDNLESSNLYQIASYPQPGSSKNSNQYQLNTRVQQVTNLLQELKNTSSSGLFPYDEKSLKLKDLEQTNSLRDGSQLKRRLEIVEKDNEMLRQELFSVKKQFSNQSEHFSYYQKLSRDQAKVIVDSEQKCLEKENEIKNLIADNDRLRIEKRQICDKFKTICEEKEKLLNKISQCKGSIKNKEGQLKEYKVINEEIQRKAKGLEEHSQKLQNALAKQRNYEQTLLQDHYSHLQAKIVQLESELKRAKNHTRRDQSPTEAPTTGKPDILEGSVKFGKRSRSPNYGKESVTEDLGFILRQIGRELHCERMEEMVEKIREMKSGMKKNLKERKLVLNIQQMVKDCTNGSMGAIIPINYTIGDVTMKSHRGANAGNHSNVENSYLVGNGGNYTTIGSNGKNTDLPRLTEIWRWIKSLLSQYITQRKMLLDQTSTGNDHCRMLKAILKCSSEEELDKCIHSLIKHKEDSERIMLMVKACYRLPTPTTLNELEMHMIQTNPGLFSKPFYTEGPRK